MSSTSGSLDDGYDAAARKLEAAELDATNGSSALKAPLLMAATTNQRLARDSQLRGGAQHQHKAPLSHAVWERDFQTVWDQKLQHEGATQRLLSSRLLSSSLASTASLAVAGIPLSSMQPPLSRADGDPGPQRASPRRASLPKRKADSFASLDTGGSPKQQDSAAEGSRQPAHERSVRRRNDSRDPAAVIEAQKARRRESARRSRLKKKDHMQQTEEELEASRAEVEFLKTEFGSLRDALQRIAAGGEASASALKRQLQQLARHADDVLGGHAMRQIGASLGGQASRELDTAIKNTAWDGMHPEGHNRAWLQQSHSPRRNTPFAGPSQETRPFSQHLNLLDPAPLAAPLGQPLMQASPFTRAAATTELFTAAPGSMAAPPLPLKSFPLTFDEDDATSTRERANSSVMEAWKLFRHD